MEIELADRQAVRRILAHFGLRAQKKWGQNFLIRPAVVAEIAEAAAVGEGDRVLEIGPGIGTLTQGLARTGAAVTAIEIDRQLIGVLARTLAPYPNVRVVEGDVLKTDVGALMGDAPFTVAANLPYYITTPILMYLLESSWPLQRLVLMMQREVAARITATPGEKDGGAITMAVQYRATARRLFDVPASSFMPAPEVVSTVVEIVPRRTPPIEVADEQLLFRLVKAGFANRRKVFRNNLKALCDAATADAILAAAQIDGTRRGETFTMEEWARLTAAAQARLSK